MRGMTLGSAAAFNATVSGSIVVVIVSIFAYSLMSAVLSSFSSDVYLERPTGLAEVIRDVVKLVPRLIGAAFLYGLVFVLGFLPAIIGLRLNNGLLIFLGVVIAMVWIFYALARFFAIYQLIVLENRGVVEAFARSGVLSKNRKGHILLTLTLIFVIFVMLSSAVTVIAGIVGSTTVSVVLQTVYTVVAYPLVGITQMILYYDARIRAEGFDIEVMTGALGAPSATSPT
jgi:hypothetical protein